MITLGIKPYGHDTSAGIVVDGKIIAAVSEERFNREKHSRKFPVNAIGFCLGEANVEINQVDEISVCFDYLKLVYHLDVKVALKYFPSYVPHALKDAIYQIGKIIKTKEILREQMGYRGRIRFLDHHDCHAASVYYSSMFKKSAILTIDGRGELASTCIYKADGSEMKKMLQINYPNSLGAFYSSITEYLGFKQDEDEGKVMGLAPYGDNSFNEKMEQVLVTKDDLYKLNLDYFDFYKDPTKNVSLKFIEVFGKPRKKNDKLTKRHKDIARATQAALEDAMVNLAQYTYEITGEESLCLAGGVALNSVGNGKILKKNIFKDVYIYPAAGDDGASIGAALKSYYSLHDSGEKILDIDNSSPYLGAKTNDQEILEALEKYNVTFKKSKNIEKDVAQLLSQNKFIGWYQGRAEFGPRALGNRSMLVDPRQADNKDAVNARIKFRESFRPFAPSTLEERASDYFEMMKAGSPYMILAFDVKKGKQKIIPAVTHIDGTARVQTVSKKVNLRYWNLINEFGKITGVPVVLNTSFNIMGEPIVNKPEQAIRCFLGCGLDVLAIEDYLIFKK